MDTPRPSPRTNRTRHRAGSRHLDPLEELFPWDEPAAAPRAAAASQTPGDAAWLSGTQPQWVRRRKQKELQAPPRAEAPAPALAASAGAGAGAGAGERRGALGSSGTQLELTASELVGPRSGLNPNPPHPHPPPLSY